MHEADNSANLSSDDELYAPPDSEITVNSSDSLLETFIGEDRIYYLERFRRFQNNGAYVSWNWPAFLVTTYWLLYRKMWALAIAYLLGFTVLSSFIEYVVAQTISEDAGTLVYFVLTIAVSFVLVPMFANRLYYDHATRKVAAIEALGLSEEQTVELVSKKGGTSWLAVIVTVLLALGLGVLFAMTVPA